MPNKLTDSEIVKALECCKSDGIICFECPYKKTNGCMEKLSADALDLINRQKAYIEKCEKVEHFADKTIATLQAENERLKSDVSVSRDAFLSMKDRYEYEKEKVKNAKQKCIDIAKALKTAKAEAYKEFAEKLENRILSMLTTATLEEKEIICACIGTNNNILKELVGDSDV